MRYGTLSVPSRTVKSPIGTHFGCGLMYLSQVPPTHALAKEGTLQMRVRHTVAEDCPIARN